MGKGITTSAGTEIGEQKFNCYKNPFLKKDVDIDKILISNKISSGKRNYKYFIGNMYDYEIKPFRIVLPKTSAYVKNYDVGIFKKYNSVWTRVSNRMKKEFDSELIYSKIISENQNEKLMVMNLQIFMIKKFLK